jgi:hypothetical protein
VVVAAGTEVHGEEAVTVGYCCDATATTLRFWTSFAPKVQRDASPITAIPPRFLANGTYHPKSFHRWQNHGRAQRPIAPPYQHL